jgi:hypothetical protein
VRRGDGVLIVRSAQRVRDGAARKDGKRADGTAK